LTAGMVLDQARYADASKQIKFVRGLAEQLRQIPGVEAVAAASDLPASGLGSVSFHIKGQPEARSNERHTTADVVVTRDYFQVAGVPLLGGRAFTEGDDAAAPRVVLVNQ